MPTSTYYGAKYPKTCSKKILKKMALFFNIAKIYTEGRKRTIFGFRQSSFQQIHTLKAGFYVTHFFSLLLVSSCQPCLASTAAALASSFSLPRSS